VSANGDEGRCAEGCMVAGAGRSPPQKCFEFLKEKILDNSNLLQLQVTEKVTCYYI